MPSDHACCDHMESAIAKHVVNRLARQEGKFVAGVLDIQDLLRIDQRGLIRCLCCGREWQPKVD